MPIQIKDKSYTMVHERLQLVHESGKTFEILASEPLACGERWVWRVTIKIDERQYIGSAEVHLNSKNPAEMQDPWATAETSGIGRAVGMAGFGSVESIASADELVRSEPTPAPSRHNGRQDAQASRRFNRSSATIASPTASRFKPDYSFANGCLCEKVVTNVIITCFLRGYQF